VPVLGYTWFPLFTMVDWRYRFGKKSVQDYQLDLGLYTLRSWEGKGGARWKATPLVAHLQSLMADPVKSVGELAPAYEAISV
jgi:hypothetical protein